MVIIWFCNKNLDAKDWQRLKKRDWHVFAAETRKMPQSSSNRNDVIVCLIYSAHEERLIHTMRCIIALMMFVLRSIFHSDRRNKATWIFHIIAISLCCCWVCVHFVFLFSLRWDCGVIFVYVRVSVCCFLCSKQYSSIFVLVFSLSLFNLNGCLILARQRNEQWKLNKETNWYFQTHDFSMIDSFVFWKCDSFVLGMTLKWIVYSIIFTSFSSFVRVKTAFHIQIF